MFGEIAEPPDGPEDPALPAGARVRDLMAHGLFDRVHVADRPAYLSALADAASRGQPQSVEFRVKRPQGPDTGIEFVWVEMRCRPLDQAIGHTRNSESREVVAVLRDVTERKMQEQALEEARSEAERANAVGIEAPVVAPCAQHVVREQLQLPWPFPDGGRVALVAPAIAIVRQGRHHEPGIGQGRGGVEVPDIGTSMTVRYDDQR